MVKERDPFYDNLRALACIMICIVHAPTTNHPEIYHNEMAVTTYSMMAGINLFFMISGSLLLPTNLTLKQFLQRRLDKILLPTLFWTFVFIIYSSIVSNWSWREISLAIICFPFTNTGGEELWFMYELVGLYLIIPIISPWLKVASKRQLEFYLICWVVYLCLPYTPFILGLELKSSIFSYIGGFVGFLVLGYYLKKHWENSFFAKWPIISILILVGIWVLPAVLIRQSTPTNCLSLGLASLTLAIYIFMRQLSRSSNRIIKSISNLSFGIYLSHCYISVRLLKQIHWIRELNILYEIILVSLLSFCGAWFFCWLISKTPFRKIVLGISKN